MIKKQISTKNITRGINTKQFIIIHHTATKEGSINGVIRQLTVGPVSCHYVIDINGDIYKIGDDNNILWHAGTSEWGNLTNMNRYSIGIEVIGPLTNGGFTFEQRKKVRELVTDLIKKYNIQKENILRHADLTHAGSKNRILWDGKSKSRKVDIASTFLNDSEGKIKYNSWKDYQNSY